MFVAMFSIPRRSLADPNVDSWVRADGDTFTTIGTLPIHGCSQTLACTCAPKIGTQHATSSRLVALAAPDRRTGSRRFRQSPWQIGIESHR